MTRKKILKISVALFLAGVLLLVIGEIRLIGQIGRIGLIGRIGQLRVARGSSSENVRGWLWSENIGWVSTNCYNDYDGDGLFENCCPGGSDCPYDPAGGNYGLTYNESGSNPDYTLSGYAWSENVGWICVGATCGGTSPDTYPAWACVGQRKSDGTCQPDCGECFNIPGQTTCTDRSSGNSQGDCPSIASGTDSHLKAHWSMNALTGAGSNEIFDLSGNNNTGTIQGDTKLAAGRFKQGLEFDGDGDYVSVPDSNSLDMSNAITLEAWVYVRGWNNYPGIVAKGYDSSGEYSLHIRNNYSIWFELDESNGTRHYYNPTNIVLSLNTWQHIAATYDGSVMRIYINGQEVGTGLSATFTIRAGTNPVYIGRLPGYGYFNGLIDNVAIYSRAKTAEEIWYDAHQEITGWAKVVSMNEQGWMKLTGQESTNNIWWGTYIKGYDLGGNFYTIGGRSEFDSFAWQTDTENGFLVPSGWFKGGYTSSASAGPNTPTDFDSFWVTNYGCSGTQPNLYLQWSPSQWAEYYSYYRLQQDSPNCPVCTDSSYTKYDVQSTNGSCTTNSCSYIDNQGTILQNKGYCYCVRAFNEAGSKWATNNPPTYPVPYWKKTSLCAPNTVAVDGTVCGQNKLYWAPVDATAYNAADGYNVYRSLVSNGCDEVNGVSKTPVVSSTCELAFHAGEAVDTETDLDGTQHLVGHWKMNETSWTGAANEVWDSSGKGNHGQAINGVSTTTGKFKKAGNFVAANGHYVKIGDNEILRLPKGNKITIEAWFKSSDSGSRGIVAKRKSGNTDLYGIFLYSTYIGFYFRGTDSSGVNNVQVSGNYYDGNWHHVAATYDTSNGAFNAYVDGIKKASGTYEVNTDIAMEGDLNIGAQANGSSCFQGLIDNVTIYNVARTSEEILRDAQAFPLNNGSANNTCQITENISISGYESGSLACSATVPCCRIYDIRVAPNVYYYYKTTVNTEAGESPASSINSGCANPSNPNTYRHGCDKTICYPPSTVEEK